MATIFHGLSFGAPVTITGEVVFNTSMTGYQEILTDPSYCGQLVTMTCPHIGNVGLNPEDAEANRPWAAGLLVREVSRTVSKLASRRKPARLPAPPQSTRPHRN